MAIDCHLKEANFTNKWIVWKTSSHDIQVATRQSQQFIVSHHSFQSHD